MKSKGKNLKSYTDKQRNLWCLVDPLEEWPTKSGNRNSLPEEGWPSTIFLKRSPWCGVTSLTCPLINSFYEGHSTGLSYFNLLKENLGFLLLFSEPLFFSYPRFFLKGCVPSLTSSWFRVQFFYYRTGQDELLRETPGPRKRVRETLRRTSISEHTIIFYFYWCYFYLFTGRSSIPQVRNFQVVYSI